MCKLISTPLVFDLSQFFLPLLLHFDNESLIFLPAGMLLYELSTLQMPYTGVRPLEVAKLIEQGQLDQK